MKKIFAVITFSVLGNGTGHADLRKADKQDDAWKCTVSAEFQCAHGKSEEISRSATSSSKASAKIEATDYARRSACQPVDGILTYFKVTAEQCVPVEDFRGDVVK